MRIFGHLFSLISVACIAVGAAFARGVSAVLNFIEDVVYSAFPEPGVDFGPLFGRRTVAVVGQTQTRSFLQRILERWPSHRSRAPLSAAFLAT